MRLTEHAPDTFVHLAADAFRIYYDDQTLEDAQVFNLWDREFRLIVAANIGFDSAPVTEEERVKVAGLRDHGWLPSEAVDVIVDDRR